MGRTKFAKRRGDGGDDEQEHHDCAVQREKAVVHFRGDPVLAEEGVLRIQQRQADQQCEDAADQERGANGAQVHDADAFVIDRGHPAPDALGLVEIILGGPRPVP